MKTLSFWSLIMDGGYIMIPLAVLLLVVVYVFSERCIVINRAAKQDKSFMDRIRDYVHDGDIESAQNLCKKSGTPYSRLIAKGLSRIGRPMNDILVAIENTGNIEVANLGKGLPWLSTTAAGAPMLGFLGTVVGMIQRRHVGQHHRAVVRHIPGSGHYGSGSCGRHHRPVRL